VQSDHDHTEGQDILDLEMSRSLSERATPKLDGYLLNRKLGEGTFGEVWSATQESTGQEVAIKLFFCSVSDWSQNRGREMERLRGVSKHTNIVSLLDANFDVERPYIVMALMHASLGEKTSASPQEIERWFQQVAKALDFIHQRGLIHCDLKPANVLLDETGQARLADFGQSVAVGQDAGALGTLGYMSPEQALSPDSPLIGWDIYSLGATAYNLLTGQVPGMSSQDLQKLGEMKDSQVRLAEYSRRLSETEIRPIRESHREADPEFCRIVERCLVSQDRRTAQVAEILLDLERRKSREPLFCERPWTRTYLLKKFVQRHLLALVTIALILFGLVSVGIVKHRNQVQMRGILARQCRERGVSLAQAGLGQEGLLWTAQALSYTPRGLTARFEVQHFRPKLVGYFSHGSPVDSVGFTPDGDRVISVSDSALKVWELSGKLVHQQVAASESQTSMYTPYTLSPDRITELGESPLIVLSDGLYQLQEAESKSISPGELKLHDTGPGSVLFERAGRHLIWRDGLESEVPFQETPKQLALSANGEWIATTFTSPNRVVVMDTNRREIARHDFDARINFLKFSPDSRRLALACRDGSVRILSGPKWSLDVPQLGPFPWRVYAAYFHPTEPLLFTCHFNGMVKSWDLFTMGPGPFELQHDWLVYGLSFSDPDHLVATYSVDGTARVWDSRTGSPFTPFLQHRFPVRAASFGPKAQHLATACLDGSVRVFQLRDPKVEGWSRKLGQGLSVISASLTKNNDCLVALSEIRTDEPDKPGVGGRLVRLKVADQSEVWGFDTDTPLTDLAYNEKLDLVAASGRNGSVFLWRADNGELLQELVLPLPVSQIAISADGRRIAATAYKGRCFLLQVDDQEMSMLAELMHEGENRTRQSTHPVYAEFSPDSDLLATALGDNEVRLWKAESGEVQGIVKTNSPVRTLDISSSGELIAIAGDDGNTTICDRYGVVQGPSFKRGIGLWDVDFSPDDTLIVTAAGDSTCRVWDTSSRKQVLPALKHPGPVVRARFSPDGSFVLTGSKSGLARIWDARTGELVQVVMKADSPVYAIDFADDSSLVLAGAEDGRLAAMPLEFDHTLSPERVKQLARLATGLNLNFNPDGTAEVGIMTPSEWRTLHDEMLRSR
jgi:WD40 repeat protein/serine/threonine protein kinase